MRCHQIPFDLNSLEKVRRGSPTPFYIAVEKVFYPKNGQVIELKGADPKTFENIVPLSLDSQMREHYGTFYYRDKNKVFYFAGADGMLVVKDADPATFEVSSLQPDAPAKDKDHRFQKGLVLR